MDLAQVRRWQDEGSIEYLGETRDVRPYVEACHALVLPSWREGTPTSIMEGMSMGRAAVVTDVPGCREVVEDGVNGCICAAHDPRALAAAMQLRSTPELTFVADKGLLRGQHTIELMNEIEQQEKKNEQNQTKETNS